MGCGLSSSRGEDVHKEGEEGGGLLTENNIHGRN